MANANDDLDAVRLVSQTLEPFEAKERERILRWVAEKLGMSVAGPVSLAPASSLATIPSHDTSHSASSPSRKGPMDIKAFVQEKNPTTDKEMVAVVAYYHQFEAPESERKEFIKKDDVLDACRKSDRRRPKRPDQVLVNAFNAGLFDKTGTAGQYRLNAVGENLVAMVLPQAKGTSSKKSPAKVVKTSRRSAKVSAPVTQGRKSGSGKKPTSKGK